jgi:hypothetical protein
MSNPRQTTVNVILKSFDATGKAQFELQPVGADPLPPPNGPDQTLTFQNDPQGVPHNGVNVDFVLIDQTGQGYAFPPNNKKSQALSSEMGATDLCPLQGMNEVLSPINVSGPNNDTLSVHNPNQGHLTGLFSYVLWVTNDGGQNYVPLDPGGNNMNGST